MFVDKFIPLSNKRVVLGMEQVGGTVTNGLMLYLDRLCWQTCTFAPRAMLQQSQKRQTRQQLG